MGHNGSFVFHCSSSRLITHIVLSQNICIVSRAKSLKHPQWCWVVLLKSTVSSSDISTGTDRYRLNVSTVRADECSIVGRRVHVIAPLTANIILYYITFYTVSQKKLCKLIFCQNFVKFRPIVKHFGTKIAERTSFSEVYSFSTPPNLCQRTTVLNADFPNCYITL